MQNIKRLIASNVPREVIGHLKIIFDDVLIIYNFYDLLNISVEKISFSLVTILGNNLSILYLDEVVVKIGGCIKQIHLKGEDDDLL